MVVRTNMMAMYAYRHLAMNQAALAKSVAKLSSGFRINRAADDPSGLAISEKMKAQIAGLEQAAANAQDGISFIQTAEAATNEIHSMLNRMIELSTKAANGTLQEGDRAMVEQEMNQLREEITRISKSTNFNGKNQLDGSLSGPAKLSNTAGTATTGAVTNLSFSGKTAEMLVGNTLTIEGKTYEFVTAAGNVTKGRTAIVLADGAEGAQIATAVRTAVSASGYTVGGTGLSVTLTSDTVGTGSAPATVSQQGGIRLQVGDTNAAYNHVYVSVDDLSSAALGLDALDFSTQEGAAAALDPLKKAINTVSRNRASLGSLENRLEYTINNLNTTAENLSEANSRIRDTDMAKEMMNYARLSILTQVAQAMLAQANQRPNIVLQMLQGM